MDIPKIGYGTWQRSGAEAIDCVTAALGCGYRHIDTAEMYGNEAEIGRALAASDVPRDQMFVTTKVWHDHLGKGEVRPALEGSLTRLGLDCVDLCLIHWPSPGGAVAVEDYMAELVEAQDTGLTRQIGISNHPIALVDRVVAAVGAGRIATNQVELHAYLQNRPLAEHCKARGIPMTCYVPLAKGRVADDDTMRRIGEAKGATAAQVALAFLMAEGHIVIPSSSNPARIAENYGALTVELDERDMEAMRALDRGERLVDGGFAPDWDTAI